MMKYITIFFFIVILILIIYNKLKTQDDWFQNDGDGYDELD